MNQPLSVGQRVELATGHDHLYNPLAMVGAKAVVRDRRMRRRFGDEEPTAQVFIQWEKEDWRYNGMPDGWTAEAHFRPVSALAAMAKPQDNEALITDMIAKAEDARRCSDCGEIHTEEEKRNAGYIEAALKAEEAIIGSEAFLVVTAKEDLNQKTATTATFTTDIIHADLNDDAARALGQRLIRLGAQLTLDNGTDQ